MVGAVAELVQVDGVHFVLGHEAQRGLERLGHGVAGVEDPVAQGDVGQEGAAVVDLIDGEDHGLQPAEAPEVVPARGRFRAAVY